jgi:two-component system chemotaxis sensor kinase CheA
VEATRLAFGEGDPSALAALAPLLDEIQGSELLPRALRTLAGRLEAVVRGIREGRMRPEKEASKLDQGLAKLASSLAPAAPPPAPPRPPPPPASVQLSDRESMDLLQVFVQKQRTELEEFEVAVLEREKGAPSGAEWINRYLHTLKGEFGVLDLGEWADLVHSIETALEERRIGTESLLRFKDLVEGRLSSLHTAEGRTISPEQRASLLPEPVSTVDASSIPPSQVSAGDPSDSGNPASDPSFLVDFIAEGGDHIHNIEKALLKLESTPTDEESINMVFRSCHTIKGLAGFLELKDIQRLAHAAENLMDRARNHQVVLGPQHVDVLLETTDMFRGMVDSIEAMLSGKTMETPPNLEALVGKLLDADYLPPLPALPTEKALAPLGELLVEKGAATEEAVENALRSQMEGDERPLGEILIHSGAASARAVGQVIGQQKQPQRESDTKSMAVEETVRVPVQKLDLLIDAIGEAVIAQSMVFADPRLCATGDLSLEKKTAQAGLMLRQIQELSMSLRMVGIRSTFQKMSRLVRDLARKLGKQVELRMEGEDTELDKTVVENIGDPLIHMVRNSMDHGLEMPDDRVARGKRAQGTIHLRAYHKAGSVFIEIEDDGKGLDRDAILRKAVQNGIARPEQTFTDSEVHQMIFLPGLSTAKAVTDVSGRGVGMDVVKKNIEALRGTVEIRSEFGRGTCFVIRLPLTLAIIQGMVVRSREERYIVPTLSILATVRPTAESLHTVVGRGEVMELRGELIRLVRISRVFECDSTEPDPLDCVVLVVEDALGRKAGIVVDAILEQQQVVIKSIGGGMAHVPGVSGGAVMSDGSVSLILDVGAVVKLASE